VQDKAYLEQRKAQLGGIPDGLGVGAQRRGHVPPPAKDDGVNDAALAIRAQRMALHAKGIKSEQARHDLSGCEACLSRLTRGPCGVQPFAHRSDDDE
jgi:hypothetical protein